MGKVIRTFLVLILLYYVYEFAFIFFESGHNITYNLSDGEHYFEVNEVAHTNQKDDYDNYSFNIKVNDTEFKYLTFYNFNKFSYILKDIKYYEDNDYKCIFARYSGKKIIHDVLCKTSNEMVYYNNISNPSNGLKEFVSSLSEYGYDEGMFRDTAEGKSYSQSIVYDDNLIPNHYVSYNYGNGFYRVNTIDHSVNVKMYDSELPTSDIKVADYVGNKYISFNYSVFDNYLMVEYRNINDKAYHEEKFDIELSRDTYTIGTYGTSIYIFDPTTLKEYEIDYESNRILEVGNISTGILYYENGEKKRISADKVNEVKFTDKFISDYENTYYVKIDKIGNKYGYYYLYKKDGDSYKIYKSDINDKENIIYIGNTSTIDKVYYVRDYIYYVDGNRLLYYSDQTGTRTIVSGADILNDSSSKIYVYEKK